MSPKKDEDSNEDYDELKGVPQWKINCIVIFFNVLLFPLYLFNKYIIDSNEEDNKNW